MIVRRVHALAGDRPSRRAPRCERSMRWAKRCVPRCVYRDGSRDAAPGDLFGIVQGGMYDDLRARVAGRRWSNIGFDGSMPWAGLRSASPRPRRLRVLEGTAAAHARRPAAVPDGSRPAARTSWLAVLRGIDMFDCVMPTRTRPQRAPLHRHRR
jgi:queuine tRNA-ribosyltransferase